MGRLHLMTLVATFSTATAFPDLQLISAEILIVLCIFIFMHLQKQNNNILIFRIRRMSSDYHCAALQLP